MGVNDSEYGEITVEYAGKRISLEFDQDMTTTEFIEEVIAPMMIGMGYFPTNVYKDLGMQETLEVIEDVVKEGRLYND